MTEETKPEEKKPEESKPEESKTEEKEPKSADEMTAAARTFIQYLKDEGFSVEEGICVLALASSLTQTEMLLSLLLKNAKVMAIPVPPPNVMFRKPSDN